MSSATAGHHNRRLLGHLLQAHSTNRPSVSPLDGSLLHWHANDFDDHNFQIHGQTLLYLFILFSIILLATLLLLYARWYFRLRHLSAVAAATVTSTPLPHPHHHHHHPCQTPPKGLDFASINSLPITLHQSSDVADDGVHGCECCICLGAFEDGDKVKVLPACHHRYHSHCVDVWLTSHSNCPLCRLPVRVDPIPV